MLTSSQEFVCLIRDKETVLYEGKAKALTSRNEQGIFDVLPQHTQFISIIKEFITIVKEDGTSQKIDIDTGIAHVFQNDVKIYLGIFSIASEKKKP